MIFFIQTWEEGSHVKLSTTTQYGLRALSDLCAQSGEGPVAVSDIARRQDIPANYLESSVRIHRIPSGSRPLTGSSRMST